jgi:hypothetical protein
MQVAYLQGQTQQADRQTEMDRPVRCSLLTLECEVHLKMAQIRLILIQPLSKIIF